MTENVLITRKSQVGYAWTFNPELEITKPDYTGSPEAVFKTIREDANLQRRGGAFAWGAWFVWHRGAWHKIADPTELRDLVQRIPQAERVYGRSGYYTDGVNVQLQG